MVYYEKLVRFLSGKDVDYLGKDGGKLWLFCSDPWLERECSFVTVSCCISLL